MDWEMEQLRAEIMDSLRDFGKNQAASSAALMDLKLEVTKLIAHSHRPDSCPAMSRHEKDHERSGRLLKTISLALGIVALLGGIIAALIGTVI